MKLRAKKKLLTVLFTVALCFGLSVLAFAAVNDTGFSDVATDAWYADSAMYVRDNGIISGTDNTTFFPDATMTRAMLATALYRAAGSPAVNGTTNFVDAVSDAYYSDALVWASENNFISGYGNNVFGVNDSVSREQIATILWRYDGSKTPVSSVSFTDSSVISAYAVSALSWAAENGIITGKHRRQLWPAGQRYTGAGSGHAAPLSGRERYIGASRYGKR